MDHGSTPGVDRVQPLLYNVLKRTAKYMANNESRDVQPAPPNTRRPWIWSEHPVFFWAMLLLMGGLLGAAAVIARRVPEYQREAALLNQRMTAAERATRDRLMHAETKRSELAIGLLRRELRIKAMQQKGVHLAISLEDSTLYLMHGRVPMRQARLQIGGDSVIRADDGRTWRLVRPVGERRLARRLYNSTYTVPEWVYVSRGLPIPPDSNRKIKDGLGVYVIELNDGTEIYSIPRRGPLAARGDSVPAQPKPASFMAEEKDLGAIIDAVSKDTPVFIY